MAVACSYVSLISAFTPISGSIFFYYKTFQNLCYRQRLFFLAQADLELGIFPTELPEYWSSRHFLSCSAVEVFYIISFLSQLPHNALFLGFYKAQKSKIHFPHVKVLKRDHSGSLSRLDSSMSPNYNFNYYTTLNQYVCVCLENYKVS